MHHFFRVILHRVIEKRNKIKSKVIILHTNRKELIELLKFCRSFKKKSKIKHCFAHCEI